MKQKMLLVGTKVKNMSAKKKIPLYVLEEKAEIARGSISKWDYIIPSVEKVSRVANILGVSMDELLKEKK